MLSVPLPSLWMILHVLSRLSLITKAIHRTRGVIMRLTDRASLDNVYVALLAVRTSSLFWCQTVIFQKKKNGADIET